MSPAGSICDVEGIAVGHCTDPRRPTGCSVVLCEEGAACGVDVRGAAPGTRETDLLQPGRLVEAVHAVLLAGGSAFGLDAAGGVMRWLAARGRGHPVGPARVPIVPAAVLFDLWLGDPAIYPDAAAGLAACEASSRTAPAEGCVGAGAGATVGKLWGIAHAMKGGIGSASVRAGGFTVGALVAVNALGDVVDPETGMLLAGARDPESGGPRDTVAAILAGDWPAAVPAGTNTTIGVVATDARLDPAAVGRLATMAHDGLARTVRPCHTQADGDTLFALATGRRTANASPTLLGTLAAEAVARAVVRAIRAATACAGLPAASDAAWTHRCA